VDEAILRRPHHMSHLSNFSNNKTNLDVASFSPCEALERLVLHIKAIEQTLNILLSKGFYGHRHEACRNHCTDNIDSMLQSHEIVNCTPCGGGGTLVSCNSFDISFPLP
jgi:hypothetical protein